MNSISHIAAQVRDFMRGRLLTPSYLDLHQKAFAFWLKQLFRRPFSRPRGDQGGLPPTSNRFAPIKPAPDHHLVAARALPPSETTHLLPYN
jgi:hypothetical protein